MKMMRMSLAMLFLSLLTVAAATASQPSPQKNCGGKLAPKQSIKDRLLERLLIKFANPPRLLDSPDGTNLVVGADADEDPLLLAPMIRDPLRRSEYTHLVHKFRNHPPAIKGRRIWERVALSDLLGFNKRSSVVISYADTEGFYDWMEHELEGLKQKVSHPEWGESSYFDTAIYPETAKAVLLKIADLSARIAKHRKSHALTYGDYLRDGYHFQVIAEINYMAETEVPDLVGQRFLAFAFAGAHRESKSFEEFESIVLKELSESDNAYEETALKTGDTIAVPVWVFHPVTEHELSWPVPWHIRETRAYEAEFDADRGVAARVKHEDGHSLEMLSSIDPPTLPQKRPDTSFLDSTNYAYNFRLALLESSIALAQKNLEAAAIIDYAAYRLHHETNNVFSSAQLVDYISDSTFRARWESSGRAPYVPTSQTIAIEWLQLHFPRAR